MSMSYEQKDFYPVLYPPFKFVLDKKFDRSVEGVGNIPDTPSIYAANHVSFWDSPLLAASYTEETGIPLRFAAKKEYFDGKGIDDKGKFGRSLRWMMQHTHMIPVDREGTNPRAFPELQTQVEDRLLHGDAIALHPEGTRSSDGRLHKFKSGAARIALALSVPIVPVGIVYSEYSNGKKIHVDVEFGKPVMPGEYTKMPYTLLPFKQKSEHLSQVVENRVADMTGMEQSAAFAKLRKLRHLPGSDGRK